MVLILSRALASRGSLLLDGDLVLLGKGGWGITQKECPLQKRMLVLPVLI